MGNYLITKVDDHWEFTNEVQKRATLRAETKKELIIQVEDFMKDKIGIVKIHKEDGTYHEKRKYPKRVYSKRSKW